MKKYIFGVLGVFLCLVVIAKAQTFNFTSNLSVGASGPEVTALQDYLINNGYTIPSISSGQASKGYFGSQTRAALIKFQNANGIPGTGFFGPLTRSKISGNNPGASLNVTYPNGGETFVQGTTQAISWNGAQGILNQTGFIKLQFEMPACAEPTNPVRCMIAVRAPVTIASNVNLANRSYNWRVGSLESVADCFVGGANCVPDGRYKIQVCSYNSSTCDVSDSYFTITANASNNKAPVINSLDAPTKLQVNQVGYWNVYAADPQGGTLSYSVDWGDSTVMSNAAVQCPAGYACQPTAAQQSSSFSHSYSNAGTYVVRFTIRNNQGLSVQSSATVEVTGRNALVPNVISPNGGEVWIANSTQQLRWNGASTDPNVKVDLYLDQTNIYCITTPCGQTFLLDKNIGIQQNYYWIVATDINNIQIAPADYKFRVCLAGSTTQCDSSDKYFTIKAQ